MVAAMALASFLSASGGIYLNRDRSTALVQAARNRCVGAGMSAASRINSRSDARNPPVALPILPDIDLRDVLE